MLNNRQIRGYSYTRRAYTQNIGQTNYSKYISNMRLTVTDMKQICEYRKLVNIIQ